MSEPDASEPAAAPAVVPETVAGDASLSRAVLGGAIAAAIAFAGFLPPLVHFVTGPLGPAIGGFFVAQRLKPDARGCIVLALTVGAAFAAVGAGVGAAIASFSGPSGPPDWFPSTGSLAAIVGGIAAYATVLAGIGATIGSRR